VARKLVPEIGPSSHNGTAGSTLLPILLRQRGKGEDMWLALVVITLDAARD